MTQKSWIQEFRNSLFPIKSTEANIERAYQIKECNIPQSIFKYKCFNELCKKDLINSTIHISTPDKFNDPYDCALSINSSNLTEYTLQTMPQQLEAVMMNNASDQIMMQKLIKTIAGTRQLKDRVEAMADFYYAEGGDANIARDKIIDFLTKAFAFVDKLVDQRNFNGIKPAFKICSFSESHKSIIMWSHYACQHRGICIEYDTDTMRKKNNLLTRLLYPVFYQNNMITMSEYITNQGDNVLYFHQLALIKSVEWQYEKEWRWVCPGAVCDEIVRIDDIVMPLPKAIYCGALCEDSASLWLKDFCKKNRIDLFKADLKPNSFDMDFLSVTL